MKTLQQMWRWHYGVLRSGCASFPFSGGILKLRKSINITVNSSIIVFRNEISMVLGCGYCYLVFSS